VTFAAIDFETANASRTSACALAVVRVEGTKIAKSGRWLIRPPGNCRFDFTWLHGIGPEQVRKASQFREVWDEASLLLQDCAFLAAHNAAFDRSVLSSSCLSVGLPPVNLPIVCTVSISRQLWQIRPTKLPDVCRRLKIPLKHHEPLSDATACAHIVLAARKAGWQQPD
jgi:DNA polymerase-3 subunit epsilon